eukprot:GHVS01016195.1.p1 GENE.GHVS01016195.1~~GHVS01016195.1.p1  ORF type:complete len:596 (+),score=132.56 GHVS01016195.1:118-1788(+)
MPPTSFDIASPSFSSSHLKKEDFFLSPTATTPPDASSSTPPPTSDLATTATSSPSFLPPFANLTNSLSSATSHFPGLPSYGPSLSSSASIDSSPPSPLLPSLLSSSTDSTRLLSPTVSLSSHRHETLDSATTITTNPYGLSGIASSDSPVRRRATVGAVSAPVADRRTGSDRTTAQADIPWHLVRTLNEPNNSVTMQQLNYYDAARRRKYDHDGDASSPSPSSSATSSLGSLLRQLTESQFWLAQLDGDLQDTREEMLHAQQTARQLRQERDRLKAQQQRLEAALEVAEEQRGKEMRRLKKERDELVGEVYYLKQRMEMHSSTITNSDEEPQDDLKKEQELLLRELAHVKAERDRCIGESYHVKELFKEKNVELEALENTCLKQHVPKMDRLEDALLMEEKERTLVEQELIAVKLKFAEKAYFDLQYHGAESPLHGNFTATSGGEELCQEQVTTTTTTTTQTTTQLPVRQLYGSPLCMLPAGPALPSIEDGVSLPESPPAVPRVREGSLTFAHSFCRKATQSTASGGSRQACGGRSGGSSGLTIKQKVLSKFRTMT